jgi:hypothetical protein
VDVTLPAYLNDHFSGAVVGRSSALYGLVLNATLEKVLRRHPIPVLIPPELQVPSGRSPEAGLVYRCLTAP